MRHWWPEQTKNNNGDYNADGRQELPKKKTWQCHEAQISFHALRILLEEKKVKIKAGDAPDCMKNQTGHAPADSN